jgi:hypothetical protein
MAWNTSRVSNEDRSRISGLPYLTDTGHMSSFRANTLPHAYHPELTGVGLNRMRAILTSRQISGTVNIPGPAHPAAARGGYGSFFGEPPAALSLGSPRPTEGNTLSRLRVDVRRVLYTRRAT